MEQKLRILVNDMEMSRTDSDTHSMIGCVELTLVEVLTQHKIQRKILYNNNPLLERGTLIITAEEVKANKEMVEMQLRAHNIDMSTLRFGKANPYIVISKISDNGEYVVVYRTEAIAKSRNPVWKPLRIPVAILCNGDYSRSLKIQCWDFFHNAKSYLIGETTTSLKDMVNRQGLSLPLINSKKVKEVPKYSDSGMLEVIYCRKKPYNTFVDYVQGGIEFVSKIIIDLSASNNSQEEPLHCIDDGPSLYEKALEVTGSLIEEYDTDNKYEVYGFGACIPPDYGLSNCFNINLKAPQSECEKMSGFIEAYRSCFEDIQLHGPSFLAPSIRYIIKSIKFTTGSHYYILWIFTDGGVTDMDEVLEAIIDASLLPLSIVIIGMGNDDFQDMQELDSDYCPLSNPKGKRAHRDIVSFIPFSQFLEGEYGTDPEQSRINLAREVLREVPDQLVSYMKMKRIPPQPPQSGLRKQPADPELL